MALIPRNDPLEHAINHTVIKQSPRPYLGLSQIGTTCHRYLQYYHYWAFDSSFTNRIQRLFNAGHNAEEFMIADLATHGFVVHGEQEEIIGTAGHWKGHIDGKVTKDGPTGLVEFKTHNDKSFKNVKKCGVKKSKITHYGQMQSYMGYKGLTWGLYMAYNKNDSEYYIEFIDFDEEYFAESKRKEMEIIASEVLLPRIGNNSITWFECKMCDARQECFGKVPVKENCRTCEFVDVLDEGKWHCNKKNLGLNTKAQGGCDQYKVATMFKEQFNG
jgi:hypothetical protein